MSVPLSLFDDELDLAPTPDDLAPTPDDILNMRAVIDAERDGDVPTAAPVSMNTPPQHKKDPFKHAGIFREYGGIKGWLELKRREKECGVCGGDKR